MKGWKLRHLFYLTVVILSIIVASCMTGERLVISPPNIPGADYVGMETCAACHEAEVRDFKRSPHARISIPDARDGVDGQGCESCHGPGSLHVQSGGGRGTFIINPGKKPEACFQCHLSTNAEFSLQYHHPVKEGRMSCTDCHDPHGDDIHKPPGLRVGRVNETCAQCHYEQARPRVFEHEALREGCVVCHNVHGSINEKLLTERDNNLCLKCHAQVAAPMDAPATVSIGSRNHRAFLTQGSCFSAGCHTAMHGSDINPHLRY